MKKFLSLLLAVLTLLSSVMLLSSCSCEPEVFTTQEGKTFHRDWVTTVVYKLDGQNVEAETNEDKNLALQGIFQSMKEVTEGYNEKKFDDNFKVVMEDATYYIAQDGEPIIKKDGKYYQTSYSDRMILNDIFEFYGAKDIYEKEYKK